MAETKEFIEEVQEILKKHKIKFTLGTGYRYYKEKGLKYMAYVKVKLFDAKKFDLGIIANTAKELGVCAGYKLGKSSFTIDGGVQAPIKELIGLKKVRYGFFVGISTSF